MLLLFDSWHFLMRMRAPTEGSYDPIAPLELPHSLHAFHRVTEGEHNVVITFYVGHIPFFCCILRYKSTLI